MFTKSPLHSIPCRQIITPRTQGPHGTTLWLQTILLWFAASLILPLAAAENPQLLIQGADKAAEKNIRAFVDLVSYQCQEPPWRLAFLKKSSTKKARRALRALGYYQTRINAEIRKTKPCWELMLNIEQGARMKVHRVDLVVTGDMEALPETRSLQKTIQALEGQPLSHADYEKAKNDLELLASRFGFFSGRFTLKRLAIDRKHNQAEIQLHYDSGPRYRFGEISIESDNLSPRLLDQFLVIRRGDEFDSEKLTYQQQVLYDSHYFASVEVIPLRSSNGDHQVPVTIRVQERKRHAYKLGIGFATDTGFRASFGFENRWLNRKGHRYDFSTNWSEISQDSSFNYGIPMGEQGTHRLDLSLGYKSEKTDTSISRTSQYGLIFSRNLPDGWKQTFSLRVFREVFETADNDESTNLLLPGTSVSKTILDNPLYPRSGWRLSAQAKMARQTWYSDLDVFQISGQSKLIRPWKNFRILARGSAGTTSTSNFPRLPATLRFYAGGDSSVRGFGYKSLGPLNADGEVNGGRNLLTGSLELEYPFKTRWGVAAFADAGNAFDSFSDYVLHKSIGIGLRYHSIIGPIRIDIAYPLHPDDGYRLHLSMGPDL